MNGPIDETSIRNCQVNTFSRKAVVDVPRKRGVPETIIAFAAVVLLSSGCAGTYRPWINQPLEKPGAAAQAIALSTLPNDAQKNSSSLLLIVNFSGGGMRAAAFSYGILDKLQNTRINWEGNSTTLRNEIDVISGVSGGSITAAFFAAFGNQTFDDFKSRFLNRDFEADLIAGAVDPATALHLMSPWYGRGNLLADQLDKQLFHGITYGQLPAIRPQLTLNITATDLSLGAGFEFTEGQFHLICSDLNSVPLAVAVAASNSVPILFSPITLKNYANACSYNPLLPPPVIPSVELSRRQRLFVEEQNTYRNVQERPYIHLVDGGLSDNLGVKRIIDSIAFSGGLARSLENNGARGIHKVVFLNVDAGRHNSFEIDRVDKIPSTMEVADNIRFSLLSHYTEETNNRFAEDIGKWRNEIRITASKGHGPFAPDADLYYVEIGLRDFPDEATRAKLLAIPTSYTLNQNQVEELIHAAHKLLELNPEFNRLITDIARPAYSPNGADAVRKLQSLPAGAH